MCLQVPRHSSEPQACHSHLHVHLHVSLYCEILGGVQMPLRYIVQLIANRQEHVSCELLFENMTTEWKLPTHAMGHHYRPMDSLAESSA